MYKSLIISLFSLYSTVEYLRKISFIGDEDHDYLRGLRQKRWELIPGIKITFTPEEWKDTLGSDKTIGVLLVENTDPVHMILEVRDDGNPAIKP